jgi:hypothetical protein
MNSSAAIKVWIAPFHQSSILHEKQMGKFLSSLFYTLKLPALSPSHILSKPKH